MIILYYIFVLIICYYIFWVYKNVFYLNSLISNYDNLIFIISDIKCKCSKNNFLKCKKCNVKNLIDIENLDELMSMLQLINLSKCKICHIIIHSEGGECAGIDAVSRLLSESKININTYIPQYAFSAGTMMSICGDSIYMNWYSLMGPLDTQLEYDEDDTFSAKHIKQFRNKSWAKEKDFLKGLEAESVHNDDEFLLDRILKKNAKKDRIIKRLLNTKFSHDMSFNRDDIKDIGLPVIFNIPDKVMNIFYTFKKIF